MENNNLKNEAGLNETYRNFFSAVFKELAGAIIGIIISSVISTICILIPLLNKPSYNDLMSGRSEQGFNNFMTIVSIIAMIYSIIQVFNIYKILKESSETLDNE